jgi:hypothetical protein
MLGEARRGHEVVGHPRLARVGIGTHPVKSQDAQGRIALESALQHTGAAECRGGGMRGLLHDLAGHGLNAVAPSHCPDRAEQITTPRCQSTVQSAS